MTVDAKLIPWNNEESQKVDQNVTLKSTDPTVLYLLNKSSVSWFIVILEAEFSSKAWENVVFGW